MADQIKKKVTTKGYIKTGTVCMVDRHAFRWPDMDEGYRQSNFHPNMVFTIEASPISQGYEFWADGYGGGIHGRPGKYGNGSILIRKKDLKNTE